MKSPFLFSAGILLTMFTPPQGKTMPADTLFKPDTTHFTYCGRIDFSDPAKPRLSGPGASVRFRFSGSSCTVLLEDQHLYNGHNYMAFELDGTYLKRIRLQKGQTGYAVADHLPDTAHELLVCKATEAQIGYVDFAGVQCGRLEAPPQPHERSIEFIGNSITAGSSLDESEVACGKGEWHDQHNACLSYGATVARMLQAQWVLSAVSGIGVCRYWNAEKPAMPQVYDNLYLSDDSTRKWTPDRFAPDIVVIGLGTNDFSDGDGSYDRGQLDSAKFIAAYTSFVKRIRMRNPQAPVCLISSPVFSDEKDVKLKEYLAAARKNILTTDKNANIHIHHFSRVYESGCDGHPGRDDHRKMAEELAPVIKKIMKW